MGEMAVGISYDFAAFGHVGNRDPRNVPVVVAGHRRRRSAPTSHLRHIPQPFDLPLPTEAREALSAGEQFLHGTLFNLALLGEELLQRLDEGIPLAQRRGDGFLLGFGGQWDNQSPEIW